MARKEKFGKFVLLDEVDSSGLGTEYRAAKLSATGLEKIVSVLRLKPALSANPEGVKVLMDQVKIAAQLQNPNVLKIYGIGKVETSYYISYEFLEGKSLRGIFARCRQDGFPFSVDHALLIASKICSALEYAHGRKGEAGRYYHGLVTPASVLVSYEGEVRVRGFGYWPARIRDLGGTTDEDLQYLAPEQVQGAGGDTKSDIYSVGAILFETLTGEPLNAGGTVSQDVTSRIKQAHLQSPTTDDDALPKPIADILNRSLALDPAGRYGEVQEMRKAIDTLLFSGDFTPTTFNLAFFMHSLFRDDIERESKALKEERESPYLEFLTDDKPKAALSTATVAVQAPLSAPEAASPLDLRKGGLEDAPTPTRAPVHPAIVPPPAHAPAAHAPATAAAAPHHGSGTHAPAPHAPAPHAPAHAPAPHSGHAPEPPSHAPARDAAAGFTFHKDEESKSKAPLVGGLVAVLLIAGAAAYFLLARRGGGPPEAATTASTAPVSTLSPEAVAAMAKVKELEEKLQAIEAEKAAAAAKAEDDARKRLEAQAAAKGQVVDPKALQRAQDEARARAQAEQEKKQQEEKKRLEDEQKAAEARLAEERRKAEEEAAAAARAAATTVPVTAPPVTAPAVKLGALVDINDAGVISPIALTRVKLTYPPIALRQRVDGTVDLSVLVDEKGNVADAKVTNTAGGKAGLNEAAIDNVRRWKFRPASKDGVAVKTWVPISIKFVLPQ
jgi:TonB family protein